MRPRWFVRGDVDGFFGLFIDNLLQLILVQVFCTNVCGIPAGFVAATILPGAALSILLGNAFYAWQARRLMRATGRDDVTALPYGINTPSLFAYIFFVMGPVYAATKDWRLAWQAGLFACLGSAVMEIAGAFVGDWLRRHTPRAALLSALAGIAITLIAMPFVFQIFANPAIALLPTIVILVAYASRTKSIFGLPGGLVAVGLGTALAWGLKAAGIPLFKPDLSPADFTFHPPVPHPTDVFALAFSEGGWRFFAVILPMGLFNVIGSIQNLESAEAAGDRFETRSSLLVNGLGSLAAGLFGSPFPTTIYIGHPGWKAMGARAGYSTLNGLVIAAIGLFGGVSLILKVVPQEAVIGILVWIGIIITAQAFQEVPKAHALAVALGLIPALAAWALDMIIKPCLLAGGKTMVEAISPLAANGLALQGCIALSQGFILTSMLWSAMLVFAVERRFKAAAGWCLAAAVLSAVGLIHAYSLTPQGIENKFWFPFLSSGWEHAATEFSAMYTLAAGFLYALHLFSRNRREGAGETPA